MSTECTVILLKVEACQAIFFTAHAFSPIENNRNACRTVQPLAVL